MWLSSVGFFDWLPCLGLRFIAYFYQLMDAVWGVMVVKVQAKALDPYPKGNEQVVGKQNTQW